MGFINSCFQCEISALSPFWKFVTSFGCPIYFIYFTFKFIYFLTISATKKNYIMKSKNGGAREI